MHPAKHMPDICLLGLRSILRPIPTLFPAVGRTSCNLHFSGFSANWLLAGFSPMGSMNRRQEIGQQREDREKPGLLSLS